MDWRVLVLITVALWGSEGVILKAVSGRLDPIVSLMWFCAGSAVSISFYLIVAMSKTWEKTFQPTWIWALVAGLFCGLGTITFFKAIPLAKGSAVIPLSGLCVLVTAVGCLVFLKEPVNARVITGIACAAAAVVLLGR